MTKSLPAVCATALFIMLAAVALAQSAPTAPIYMNASAPVEKRVDDLIHRMSPGEKVAQLQNSAPAIPRLGVPGYNYWNEGLHGIAREGNATVFPQAIGMAATWDNALIKQQGDAVSTEARAKYNANKGNAGNHGIYNGLTLWSPNINIFRDPRWGRGQETYGEDPWLTSRMGVAYITGLQGDDPRYLKVLACAKHFAVHSGPEVLRHQFDARPPERDLYETYLPQFEAAVREANVGQVMSAYNAVYGVPAAANGWMLTDLLRKQWGFNGYVVSDCDAVADVSGGHHYAVDNEHAAADCLLAGNDLNCGTAFHGLVVALRDGLVKEADIDAALRRVFTARFRLGMFDPPDFPYAKITIADNDTPEHSALALQVARESMVLLKNNGALPLDKTKLRQIAVIGANASDAHMLEGNYSGKSSHPVTILQGITNAAGPGIKVTYDAGCPLAGAINPQDQQKALADAAQADVLIYVGGLNQHFEGEEGEGGDRTSIELPDSQDTLLKALAATGKPVIFVNCSGSAMAMPWEAEHLPAILQAWYPGENGAAAVADLLFGNYNPAGRLPVTFYKSTQDLPDFQSYSMANRTYRYFTGQPLYAFGHGLSYTKFTYGGIGYTKIDHGDTHEVTVSVDVTNSGGMDGDEVVQLYAKHPESAEPQATHSLVAFRRVHIPKGQTVSVSLPFATRQLRTWDTQNKRYVIQPGQYELQVGAASDDIRGTCKVTVP